MATGSGENFTNTTQMGLPLPVPGVCGPLGVEPPGTSWMELQNAAFAILDGHNHAPGFGVPVAAAGLNIDADLPFGSNNATGLRSARFVSQPSPLAAAAPDLRAIYAVGDDLYYNDGAGNQVRLTQAGGVAGSPGSISGLASPAAAAYVPVSSAFEWTSNTGTYANMKMGPAWIFDAVANGKYVRLQAPSGLAASYAVTLPTSLPASTLPLSLSATGGLSAAKVTGAQVEDATLTATHLTASAGILGSQLAAAAGITGSQLADATLTNAKQNFGTPVNPTDVAIMSYVDGKISLSSGTVTEAANWDFLSTTLRKDQNGFTYFEFEGVYDDELHVAPSSVGTLPAGFRPAQTIYFTAYNATASSSTLMSITSAGVVDWVTGSIILGETLKGFVVFMNGL